MASVSFQRLTASRTLRAALLPTLVVASLASCSRGASSVRGSGTIKTESRPVTGFSHIVLDGTGDLTITQSGAESLTVEADDNLVPLITSTVAASTLEIRTTRPVDPTKRIHYTVTVKDFSGFDLLGSASAVATQIDTAAIKIVISGAGDAKISGKAQSQDITISGAGDYEAPQLASKTTRVTINGAGNAVVEVSDALDVRISGAGDVAYIGDPKVAQSISGTGKVHKR
jgi:Putative auto-transporter adhesin, head GIN domain